MAIAIVVPPVLAGIFLPIFHQVQSSGLPAGSLEGIDLTPFAQRDERMMLLFACILFLFIIAVGIGVRPWRRRLTIMLVASAAAFIAYAAVFVALLAG
jgi:Ca2+/Na+ antiporter